MAVCSRRTAWDNASASEASEFHVCGGMRSMDSTPTESVACWSNSSGHTCTETTEALNRTKRCNTRRHIERSDDIGPTFTWSRRAVVLSSRRWIVRPWCVMLRLHLSVTAAPQLTPSVALVPNVCAVVCKCHASFSGVASQHTFKEQPVLKF